MAIKLVPLPYPVTALAPAISSTTLELHHGKHHKGYVDKVNALATAAGLGAAGLGAIIAATADGAHRDLYNQAAQVWNHGFYWVSITPEDSAPSAELGLAIEAAFGSLAALKLKLTEAGAAHFGSGWVWLAARGDTLVIETTHDADLPRGEGVNPLLVLDLWEHAYYLDHRNDRKGYLAAVAERIDWHFASENFRRKTPWNYPS